MTAEQILKICQLECPTMALTTVYRNLDRMVELGFATKINSAQGAARYYAATPESRIQLFCRMCNGQIQVGGADIKLLEAYIYEKTGFEIEKGNLEFYGVCKSCRRHMPGA